MTMSEERIVREARARAVEVLAPLVGEAEVAQLVSRVHQLYGEGRLLGVPQGDQGNLFPVFQVDPEAHALRPGVAEVNLMLDAHDDPWGAASWWATEQHRIPGDHRAPWQLILDGQHELVVALANAVLDD